MYKHDLIKSSHFRVSAADTDMFGRLRLSAVLNYLIEAAIQSADELGFGFKVLKQQNLFWVLSRIIIQLNKPVRWNEKIVVKTWPKNVEKIMYIRDYIIEGAGGDEIGRVTSGWLAVDLDRKRPAKVITENPETFYLLKALHGIAQLPGKVQSLNSNQWENVPIAYSDIDLNRHVFSPRYADWMMNMLPVSFHASNYPRLLTMNFMNEIPPDEEIALNHQLNKDGLLICEGKQVNSDKIAFRGSIQF